MRRSLLVLLFFSLGLGLIARTEIRLKTLAEVAGEEVRLGEIASLHGEGLDELGELVLTRFEPGRHELEIDYTLVSRRLRLAGVKAFYLVGSSVLVTRPTRVLVREDLLDFVRRELQRSFPGRGIELDSGALPDSVRVLEPFSGPRLETESRSERVWVGRLVIAEGDRSPKSYRISAGLKTPGRVFYAKRALKAGTYPALSDFSQKEVLDLRQSELVSDYELIKGRRLISDIERDTPLSLEMFEKPLVIRRGVRCSVLWQGAGIVIEVQAEALEDARVGDRIRFRNPLTAREFRALVRERGGEVYADG